MTPDERLEAWIASKQGIAKCRECLDRWPTRVEQTLRVDEIPDPGCDRDISILFVGVAPPPLEEGMNVGHFYTNPGDRLRLGLFHVLDRMLSRDLSRQNQVDPDAATTAFLDTGFFFVHAAKVHPSEGRLAPDRDIMRFCAKKHLAHEILLLRPKAICLLGATNASPAAEAVFERKIGEVPLKVQIAVEGNLESWAGWAAVTVQPVRGTKKGGSNRERTLKVIQQLRDLSAGNTS